MGCPLSRQHRQVRRDWLAAGPEASADFAGPGTAGEAAANDAYRRAVDAGIDAAVYLALGGAKPDGKLSDFNDDLLAGHKADHYAAFMPANSPPESRTYRTMPRSIAALLAGTNTSGR
jgi:hypothetical protein